MKKTLLIFAIFGGSQVYGQHLLETKIYKDKKVHAKHDVILDVAIQSNGNIVVNSAKGKGKVENAIFDSDFKLLEVQENASVPVDTNKVKQESGAERYEGNKLILKDNVLSVGSRFLGLQLDGGGINMILQQGRIVRQEGYVDDHWRKGSYSSTTFEPVKEIKLKSEEGKNMEPQFYKADGEEFLFANSTEQSMTVIEHTRSTVTTTNFYNTPKASVSEAVTKTYDTYTPKEAHYSSQGKTRKLIDASGDLVLLGKRRPIIKFGKKPSLEDLMPYYYIFKYSAKTMDVISTEKFQEPVSRIITFRKSLYTYGGFLIVSVPTNVVGEGSSPKDEHVNNYVFRHIGDDGKLSWTIEHLVPSGFTRFTNVIEMKDGSLLLTGTYSESKADKYYNKIIGTPADGFYTMVIKDKKVVGEFKCSFDELDGKYTAGDGSKLRYDPGSRDYLEFDDIRSVDNDETIVFSRVMREVQLNGGRDKKTINKGYLAFHFDKGGKLLKIYGVGNESEVQSPLTQSTLRTGPTDLTWVTFEAQDDEGKYMLPRVTKINFATKTAGKTIVASDGDHFVTMTNPMFIDLEKKTITFFGFDKKGKELWWQPVALD